MGFFNRYPYTDFHELSLDFLIREVKSMKTSIDEISAKTAELEEIVTGHESRIDALETSNTAILGRLDALEDNVSDIDERVGALEDNVSDIGERVGALEDNVSDIDGRVNSLESADIQNATMLSDMSGVTCDANEVVIEFSKATYTNGEKTTGTENATLPAATQSAAGVMKAEDKQKLSTYTLDNQNHAVFAQPVAGPSPVGNNDYATKAYVDNLAISGQAEPTKGTAIASANWNSSYISDQTLLDLTYRSYGSIRSYYLNGYVSSWSAIPYDGDILYGDTVSAAIPAAGHMAFGCGHAIVSNGSGYDAIYPLDFRITNSGRVNIIVRNPGGIPAKTTGQDTMIIQLQCVFIDV